MPKKLTTEEFICRSISIHENRYDYSNVEYINNSIKVVIGCPDHGQFNQQPKKHLIGRGCPKCSGHNKTTNDFIDESNTTHNYKYDYSKTVYTNAKHKVIIICSDHGEFTQTPNSHLSGQGCPKCGEISCRKTQTFTTQQFIQKAQVIHNNLYDYSETKYIKIFDKVRIKCNNCDSYFDQEAHTHLKGSGCPRCRMSLGERKISSYLKEHNIIFETEKMFDGCRNKLPLRFDFYIPSLNTCIEFDGRQHFEAEDFFGGDEGLKNLQLRDSIKDQYCKDKNIPILRISYRDMNKTEDIIKEFLPK